MSENLDSRALRHTDCYGQRFMKPGTYSYALVPAGGVGIRGPPVRRRRHRESSNRQDMHQTTVTVRFVKERHGDCCEEQTSTPCCFVPDQERVIVEVGDMVVWNSPDAATRPFAVEGQQEFFPSQRVDHGVRGTPTCSLTPGDPRVRRRPRLRAPRSRAGGRPPADQKALLAWQSLVGEDPGHAAVGDSGPEPAEVEIMMGQNLSLATAHSQEHKHGAAATRVSTSSVAQGSRWEPKHPGRSLRGRSQPADTAALGARAFIRIHPS